MDTNNAVRFIRDQRQRSVYHKNRGVEIAVGILALGAKETEKAAGGLPLWRPRIRIMRTSHKCPARCAFPPLLISRTRA